jgi:hypothetical protein
MDARSAKALSKDDWAKMAGDADSMLKEDVSLMVNMLMQQMVER